MPIKGFKPPLQRNSKYTQGRYVPINPTKYVGDIDNILYRSFYELVFMKWCDKNQSVLKWGSEDFTIQYVSPFDKKVHRYYPDFIIKVVLNNGQERIQIIEIKPNIQTKPPVMTTKKKTKRFLMEEATYLLNTSKWDAAKLFADSHNMDFILIDEYDLGIKKRPKD